MAYKVVYKSSVSRDLKHLDKQTARRIIDKIEKVLLINPDVGVPLTGEFRGLYKYRIGNHRVIFSRTADQVLILRIGHRKDVYRAKI